MPWKRWEKKKYKNRKAMKPRRLHEPKGKRKRGRYFCPFMIVESLPYFTSPRKLLSLRCSRSLIIDYHMHHTSDDEE